MKSPTSPFMTTAEVARDLDVTIRTVERWRESGYFIPEKRTPGGHSRYRKDQVCQLKRQRQLIAMMF